MSSGVEKGLIDNVSVTNFICNTYSIRMAIWISRTAIYCDTVLVGDTRPYCAVKALFLEMSLVNEKKMMNIDINCRI